MINLTIQSTIQSTIKNTLGNLSEKFITQLFVPVGSDSFITADNKIFKVRVDMSTLLYLFAEDQRGVWYDPSDLATMYQESTGTTPVTADGQPVGLIQDKSGNDVNALQPVSTKRPTYNATPDRLTLDLVDDSLAFTVPTGGIDGYMVVGTNDGTASYGVSLPAGDYDIGGDYFMGGSVNGFLLREGVVSASDLRNVEKDFVSKGAKASYGDVTNFGNYWRDKGITEFPLIDTSMGTSFNRAWQSNDLTSFPLINTSSGTNFFAAWYGNNLTSFPLIDTSSGASFEAAWFSNNLTSFPLIDTSSGTNFAYAWFGNNLTSFPALDFSSGTNFGTTWLSNLNLTDFPANMFDNCSATRFDSAFTSTNLSQSSIDGILVSIESNGTSNGTFDQSGGSAPSSVGEAAIDAMRSRGWTVNVTGGY